MGLFGALFAGVSGLDSQSNKIGIISNNISNVNTVGYKQAQANFDTLVVPSGTTSFSPGGAIGGNQQLVNQQGTIAASTSATDVAISGNGFLVVSQTAAGVSGGDTPYYTRAGSFTQDSQGNFVNSDGYYLQGLPIEQDGQPEQANNQNLTTVKISQSATGSPTATTTVAIDANLNAQQAVFPGSSGVANMTALTGTSAANANPTGTQIIVPSTTGSKLTLGNSFTITSSTSAGAIVKQDVYTYGGFAAGRSVLTGNPDTTDTNTSDTFNTETGQTLTIDSATNTATITVTDPTAYAAPLINLSISGITANVGNYTPAMLNGDWTITGGQGTGTLTIQLGSASASVTGGGSTTTETVSNRTYPFTGNILNAKQPSDDFLTTVNSGGTALTAQDFASTSLSFTAAVSGGTAHTFTYNSNPNPSSGQFNNINTLVQAINDTTDMTATYSTANGELYISATNPNLSVTFANGNAAGTPNTNPPLPGINWLQELGLPSSLPAPAAGITYFNSLQSLANDINGPAQSGGDTTNLTAVVNNPNASASLSITEANPEQTITFADGNTTTSPATTNTNNGSVLEELGFSGLNLGTQTPPYTVSLGVTYSALNPNLNMSSGKVTPQFSKDITIYDSEGFSHTLALNYLKIGTNEWAVEVTAVPTTDVTGVTDGQLASGNITFDGNGNLLSQGNIGNFNINWENGASQSSIALDFGKLPASATDGSAVTQTAGPSTVSQVNQNGAPTGELTGVTIDQNGFVIAAFSNGQTQKLYQVPLAVINNPDGLEAVSGNAYQQTLASGEPSLDFATQGGAGQFTPSALEQSNVDLSTQLTDLIVAQQAYGANSKLLTVADTLLQELDQIIQ